MLLYERRNNIVKARPIQSRLGIDVIQLGLITLEKTINI